MAILKNIALLINAIVLLASYSITTSIELFAQTTDHPVISIIIDDIGYRHEHDQRALALPGPVAFAIMPHSPFATKMSEMVNLSGRDVLLHLPMEAMEDENNRFLGPGALKLNMSQKQFIATLGVNMRSLPNIVGVNNHMGSLLTMDKGRMDWLMEYLNLQKVFYVDSVTSRYSVAARSAYKNNVPYLRRDVFLDNYKDADYIDSQFNELIAVAKRKGKAVAIGHPYPQTIEVLSRNLNRIERYGVSLISITDMLKMHDDDFHNTSLRD